MSINPNVMNQNMIKMHASSFLDKSLINSLHQSVYIRWNESETSVNVNSMDWQPNGERLLVSSDDKTIRVFDCFGNEMSMIPSRKHGCDLAQFMADGHTAIHASKYEAIRDGKELHKIRHLDLNKKSFIHYYCGHEKEVTSISINHTQNCFLSSSLDSTVRLWDCRVQAEVTSGDRLSLATLNAPNGRLMANFDPLGVIFAVGIYSTSKSNAPSIRLYDLRNYGVGPFKVAKFEFEASPHHFWHQMKFSPNGKLISIATNGNCMQIIDSYSLQDVSKLSGMRNDLNKNLELSFSSDSQFVFCGSSSSFARPGDYAHLNVFDVVSGKHTHEFKTMHESFMSCVKFNPKFYLVATSCNDVSIWSPESKEIDKLLIKNN